LRRAACRGGRRRQGGRRCRAGGGPRRERRASGGGVGGRRGRAHGRARRPARARSGPGRGGDGGDGRGGRARARGAAPRAEATEAASARAAAALPDLGRDEPFVPPSAALKTCGPALRTSWCEARPCMSGQLTAAVLPQKGDDAAVMLAKAYAPNNARVSTHTPSAVHIGASPTAGEPKVCGSRAAGAHRKCAGESTAHAAVPAGMGRMPGKSRAGAQLEG